MERDGYTSAEDDLGSTMAENEMESLKLEALARKHQHLPEIIEDEFRSLRAEVSEVRDAVDNATGQVEIAVQELREMHVNLMGNKPWTGLDKHLPTIKGLLWAIFITLLVIAFR